MAIQYNTEAPQAQTPQGQQQSGQGHPAPNGSAAAAQQTQLDDSALYGAVEQADADATMADALPPATPGRWVNGQPQAYVFRSALKFVERKIKPGKGGKPAYGVITLQTNLDAPGRDCDGLEAKFWLTSIVDQRRKASDLDDLWRALTGGVFQGKSPGQKVDAIQEKLRVPGVFVGVELDWEIMSAEDKDENGYAVTLYSARQSETPVWQKCARDGDGNPIPPTEWSVKGQKQRVLLPRVRVRRVWPLAAVNVKPGTQV